MALKLPAKIFLFLQKMNLRTLYFKPIVASTLVHTHYPTAIWDEVCPTPAGYFCRYGSRAVAAAEAQCKSERTTEDSRTGSSFLNIRRIRYEFMK